MTEQVTFQEVIPEKVYITRCKDCAYSKELSFSVGQHKESIMTCSRWQYAVTEPDGFCSRAMRRIDR